MRLWSYIIRVDTGFAPNPFGGFCSLATCKPFIRRYARVDDWIIGTGSATAGLKGRLVYAMHVDEIVSWDRYGSDPRFEIKRPSSGSTVTNCGDCIYFRDPDGEWKLRHNRHHGLTALQKDVLNGKNVLVGRSFYYFGRDALQIPIQFQELILKRHGQKYRFDQTLCLDFVQWLASSGIPGIHGAPNEWSEVSARKLTFSSSTSKAGNCS